MTSMPITTSPDTLYTNLTISINFKLCINSAFKVIKYISCCIPFKYSFNQEYSCILDNSKFSLNVGFLLVINDDIIVVIPGHKQLFPNN